MGSTPHVKGRFVSQLTRDTLALVLAGGRGSRLKELTDWRAKPAMPFGGKFRIVDFPLSNCVNSDIRRIAVLTQYKAHSLILHIQRGWSFMRGELGEFVELLPAQQRLKAAWYSGTADAVYQNIDIIRSHAPEFVLILAGDHIYKMDYGTMLAAHVESEADVTIGCIEVPIGDAHQYGVMTLDESERIVGFAEKPSDPTPARDNPELATASMGIYVFSTDVLIEELLRDALDPESGRDFGGDVIPYCIENRDVQSFRFVDESTQESAYWRDVGTLDAFWEANLELTGITPPLNLYDDKWPIWTYQAQMPPAKFVFNDDNRRGMAVDSLVAGGCIVSGSHIKDSLLFSSVQVHSYCSLEGAVVFPGVEIGRHCRIRNAIIDTRCVIPPGMIIGEDPESDASRFRVSEKGVVLVTPDMLGQRLHYAR